MFAIRLIRIIPMLGVLAVVAVVFYGIMRARYSSPKAKSYLIRVFFAINVAGCIVFLLATLYALLEENANAFDLMACFFITFLIGLAITLLCRWRFLKHNPSFRFKAVRATTQTPWRRLVDYFKHF